MEQPSGKLECVITYLEMTEPPTSPTPPRPASKLALLRAEAPTVAFYRFLYNPFIERGQLLAVLLACLIHARPDAVLDCQ